MALQPRVPYAQDQIKFVMSFKSSSKRWQEVHWYTLSTPANLNGAQVDAAQLAYDRWNMLATDCMLINQELSCAISIRNTARSTAQNGILGTTVGPSNESNDCVRLLMRGSPLVRKSIYLGGIPDDVITNDAYDKTNWGTFPGELTTYVNTLTNGKWGWMATGNPASGPRVKILSIQVTGGLLTTFIVTTQAPHGLATGFNNVVRLSRCPDATQALPFNQLFRNIEVADDTHFTIVSTGIYSQPAGLYLKGGFAQNEVLNWVQYKSLAAQFPETRIRGVRENPVRGRRKFKRTIGF